MPTKQICSIIKDLLKSFRYTSCEEVLESNNFKKDLIILDDQLLLKHSEGFYQGKLIIKSFEYQHKFRVSEHKLTNFHKVIGITNKDNARLFYQNLLKKSSSMLNIYEINHGMISAVNFLKKHFIIDENIIKPI